MRTAVWSRIQDRRRTSDRDVVHGAASDLHATAECPADGVQVLESPGSRRLRVEVDDLPGKRVQELRLPSTRMKPAKPRRGRDARRARRR